MTPNAPRPPGRLLRAHEALWAGLKLWLLLLALFSLGRAFYLGAYWDVLRLDPYAAGEIATVLLSAVRFDSAASVALALPALLVALAGRPRPTAVAAAIATSLAWILVVVDHYFYVFFKDHLNVFFWEFLENASNAWLVAGGAGDEVSLARALAVALAGILGFAWAAVRL